MLARAGSFLLGIVLITAAGCGPGKLDVNKTYTVDEPKIVLLDKQSHPQNIKVEFDSDQPVTVMLIKDSDLGKDDDGSIMDPKKAVAAKTNEKSGNFTGEIPANTASRVIVKCSQGKANVKLHITNQ